MYIVAKQFRDVDGQVKVEGQIIEIESFRAPKLISQGYIVPVSKETIQSLLQIINSTTKGNDSKLDNLDVNLLAVAGVVTDTNSNKLGDNDQLWGNASKTVLGYSNATYKHIHNPSYVFPADCSLVSPVSSATADTFGDFVELVPENGITVAFDIHWANIQDISGNGTFIVELHEVSNADLQVSEKFLGSFSVSRQSAFTRSFQVYTQIPVVPANKRIGTRVKNSNASAETISFNVMYHDYE